MPYPIYIPREGIKVVKEQLYVNDKPERVEYHIMINSQDFWLNEEDFKTLMKEGLKLIK